MRRMSSFVGVLVFGLTVGGIAVSAHAQAAEDAKVAAAADREARDGDRDRQRYRAIR